MNSLIERLGGIYDIHGEKLRFLIVGVWNTLLSYGLFVLVVKLFATRLAAAAHIDFQTAVVVLQWSAWVLAVVQSTVTMKYLAFRSKGHLGKQVMRAYFIYLPAQGLSSLILYSAMRYLGLSPAMGQLLAVVVTTVFSYFGHKYFTFRVPLELGELPDEALLSGDDRGLS